MIDSVHEYFSHRAAKKEFEFTYVLKTICEKIKKEEESEKVMKKMIPVLIALLIVFGLAACQPSTGATTQSPTEPAATTESTASATAVDFPEMKLTVSDPNTEKQAWGQGLVQFKDNIEQATNGKVTIDVYFSNSLVPQDQEFEATMKGTVDFSAIDFNELAAYYPELGMFSSAYFFKDLDHFKTFVKSDVAKELFDKVEKDLGIHILPVAICTGSRDVNLTTDRKVTSRADLKDIKLRTINADTWLLMGKALGANSVPVGFADLYVALQNGTVDGEENPVATMVANSFFEVTKSITRTGHVLSVTMFGINSKKWSSMSPELQQIVSEAIDKAATFTNDTTQAEDAENVKTLESKGVTVYTLTPEELASYSQEVKDFYLSDPASQSWDMDLYQKVQDMAK